MAIVSRVLFTSLWLRLKMKFKQQPDNKFALDIRQFCDHNLLTVGMRGWWYANHTFISLCAERELEESVHRVGPTEKHLQTVFHGGSTASGAGPRGFLLSCSHLTTIRPSH